MTQTCYEPSLCPFSLIIDLNWMNLDFENAVKLALCTTCLHYYCDYTKNRITPKHHSC